MKTPGSERSPATATDGRYRVRVTVDAEGAASRCRSRSRWRPAGEPDLERVAGRHQRGRPAAGAAAAPLAAAVGRAGRSRRRRSPSATIPELKGGDWARGRASSSASRRRARSATRSAARAARSARTSRTSSTATTPRCCATSTSRAPPSTPTTSPTSSRSTTAACCTGRVRTEGDRLDRRRHRRARSTTVDRAEVEAMRPSPVSIMPEGLRHGARPGAAARPADVPADRAARACPTTSTTAPPPPRRRAEVDAVLPGQRRRPRSRGRLRIVLVAGPKDHGPGEHDYPAVAEALVDAARDWPTTSTVDDRRRLADRASSSKTADVIVFYPATRLGRRTKAARARRASSPAAAALVYIHYAVDGGTDAAGLRAAHRPGLAGRASRSSATARSTSTSPGRSTRSRADFDKLQLRRRELLEPGRRPDAVDVLGDRRRGRPAAAAVLDLRAGEGARVRVSIPGHYAWTFDDPLFRVLLLRGIAWTAREPVDRFNELATIGAKVAD